jgi:hypothetical protein
MLLLATMDIAIGLVMGLGFLLLILPVLVVRWFNGRAARGGVSRPHPSRR